MEKVIFELFVEKWVEKKFFNKNGKFYFYIIFVKYLNYLKNYIFLVLGYKKIDKIKSFYIVDFIDDLFKDGVRKDGKFGGLGD